MRPPGRAIAHGLWSGLQEEQRRYEEAVGYIPQESLKLQEDLRRYICLRCAGFLEQVTYEILTDYLSRTNTPGGFSFVSSFFKQAPNLNYASFVTLMERFGPDCKNEFEEFLRGPRKDALADLSDARNDIAHGKVAGGRRLTPKRYIDLAEDVYEWLVDKFIGGVVDVYDESGERVGYEV